MTDWPGKAKDSPRWCATCQSYGNHHTDRHDEMTQGPPMTADLARRDGHLYAAHAHTHELADLGHAIWETAVDSHGVVHFRVRDKFFMDVVTALELRPDKPMRYGPGYYWTARGVRAGDHGQAIEVTVASIETATPIAPQPQPDPAAAEQFDAHQSGQFGKEVQPSWLRQ